LAYEAIDKHLSFDTKFIDDVNKKISSEISKVSYGSGGGGNVDLYVNGEKAVKNLRSINFTGDGFNVTPDGTKATITTNTIPGIGEFTIDVNSGAVKPWFKVNALKKWIDNDPVVEFPANEQPDIVTYEDYWNCLNSVIVNLGPSDCGGNLVGLSVFLGLVYICEVDNNEKEPMQLCIHANSYNNQQCGTIGTVYPPDDLDWSTWTSSSTGFPPLFDSNFDGVINVNDAINVMNYGYRAYGWGFTTGGGDQAISTENQINPRFVEGKEYYIWIQAPHPDATYDNFTRVLNNLDGGSF
jgi:hypothetical protein